MRAAAFLVLLMSLAACGGAATNAPSTRHVFPPQQPREPARVAIAPLGADTANLDESAPAVATDTIPIPGTFEYTLPNGLRVAMLQRRGIPMVIVTALLDTGIDDAPPATAALGFAALHVSSPSLRPPRLLQITAALGIDFRSKLDDRYMSFQMAAPAPSLGRAIDLLARILQTPEVRPEDISRVREIAGRNLLDLARAPGPRAALELTVLVDNHIGSLGEIEQQLKKTPTGDVSNFAQRAACPQRAMISIVGDFEPVAAELALAANLRNWACVNPPPRPRREVHAPIKHVRIVDHPGDEQAQVAFGAVVPSTASERQIEAAQVLAAVLGGRRGRLFRSIRDEAALAYGINADLDRHRSFQVIRVLGDFATEESAQGALEVLTELARVREELVPDAELSIAARRAAAQRLVSLWSLSSWLGSWSTSDKPLPKFMADSQRPSTVTAEEVRQAAKQFLAPEHVQIVFVGDAKKIRPALEAAQIGPVDVVE